jgi:UDP-N-acetylmuramoylalanine--D-glutamate ligase
MSHILTARQITHQLAGNIGIPIFQAAAQHTTDTWYILEWSSYQLELCAGHLWQIHAGGVLNLSPHHLERHHDMQRYGSIKGQLLAHSTYAVVDSSGSYIDYVTTQNTLHPHMTYIGPSASSISGQSIRYDEEGIHDGVISLTLAWLPQWSTPAFRQNCTMAYTLLQHIQGALAHFLEDIAKFKPLEHRQEPCLVTAQVQCINDSKATTPEATLHALKAYSAPLLWIAGGVVQQDDLDILKSGLSAVTEAFLYGQAAKRFAQFLQHQIITCSTYPTLEAATHAAWEKAKQYPSSVILCSPACPSFDAFRDFMERGRAFKAYVHHLSNTPHGALL